MKLPTLARFRILDQLWKTAHHLDLAIMATPTSAVRNELTEVNIKLQAVIQQLSDMREAR
jgi:hypothetical protein